MANSNSSNSKILNQASEEISVMYRECWRNHAVLLGGYAADGCGEFIPKGNQGTKEALLCEACDCHRNFHRKELVKNGLTLVASHTFAPSMGGESNSFWFYPLPSLFPYYELQNQLISDEESVICSGNEEEGEMEVRQETQKRTLLLTPKREMKGHHLRQL